MTRSMDWQTLAEKEWNNKAENWHANSKNMWEQGSRKTIIPFLKKHFLNQAKILDIGCGSGYSTNKLEENSFSVIGMDISINMVELATHEYPHLHFQHGDVHALPYANKRFDGILAVNVLEWSEIPINALQEIHRVLKNDGQLCIGVLGPTAGPRNHSYKRLYGKQVMMNTMQPWEFAQLAKENGFDITDNLYVPKQWNAQTVKELPIQAQQALSFMWVFMCKKVGEVL